MALFMVLGIAASLFGVRAVPAGAARVDCGPTFACVWEQTFFQGESKEAWDDAMGVCDLAPVTGARSAFNHTSPRTEQPEPAVLQVFEGTGCQANVLGSHQATIAPGESVADVGFVIRSFCLVTRNTGRCQHY